MLVRSVETLGRAIVVNLPTLLSFFYKGISPFLDPVTRDKVSRSKISGPDQVAENPGLDAFQPRPIRVDSKGTSGR